MKKQMWLVPLVAIPGVFVAGFLGIVGINLGNNLFTGTGWKQAINLTSTQQDNVFTAVGDAKLSAIPDQAVISLGINLTDNNIKTAQDKVNQTIEKFKADLFALQIDKKDLKTQNYSLYPNYDWNNDSRKIINYTVSTNLEVTLNDFALLNQVIDLATSAGINQIGNISFTLSDSQQASLKQEARRIAIEQAKDNAKELAQLTGIQLGQIINIQENQIRTNPSPISFRTQNAKEDLAVGGVPTNIEAGETNYDYRVTLSYQTL